MSARGFVILTDPATGFPVAARAEEIIALFPWKGTGADVIDGTMVVDVLDAMGGTAP